MTKNRNNAIRTYRTFSITNPIIRAVGLGVLGMDNTSVAKYKSQLHSLVFTGIGQRVMMPTYGTRIPYLLFEPHTHGLYEKIDEEIRSAVRYWIPDINIDRIEFGTDEANVENNRIAFTIHFSLKLDSSIQDFIQIEATL